MEPIRKCGSRGSQLVTMKTAVLWDESVSLTSYRSLCPSLYKTLPHCKRLVRKLQLFSLGSDFLPCAADMHTLPPTTIQHTKIITNTETQFSGGLLGQTGSTLGRAHKQACRTHHPMNTSEHIMLFN